MHHNHNKTSNMINDNSNTGVDNSNSSSENVGSMNPAEDEAKTS